MSSEGNAFDEKSELAGQFGGNLMGPGDSGSIGINDNILYYLKIKLQDNVLAL